MVFSAKGILQRVSESRNELSPIEPEKLKRCVEATARVSRRLYPKPSCLTQALALTDMLTYYGINSKIQLHFRRGEKSSFLFHALVTVNDQCIYGNHENWFDAKYLKKG